MSQLANDTLPRRGCRLRPDGYNAISDIPMGSGKSVENVRLKQSQKSSLRARSAKSRGWLRQRSSGDSGKIVFARLHKRIGLVQMQGGAACRASRLRPLFILFHHPCLSWQRMMSRLLTSMTMLSHPPQDSASMMSDHSLNTASGEMFIATV